MVVISTGGDRASRTVCIFCYIFQLYFSSPLVNDNVTSILHFLVLISDKCLWSVSCGWLSPLVPSLFCIFLKILNSWSDEV